MANPQACFDQSVFAKSSFWDHKQHVMLKSTIPFQLEMLKKTGRYNALDLKWQEQYSAPPNVRPIPNHQFFESDIGKWIEGACYLLKHGGIHPSLDVPIAFLVNLIRDASQADGYLNIHYTVVEPGKRFTNLRDMHELYNAGHLIEAALAHHKHYGNDDFLEPMKKYADLLCNVFGPGDYQVHGYPGHPEIELALVRLYKVTKELRYLDLARFFINERGNPDGVDGQHYFDNESIKRGEPAHSFPEYYPARRSYWYQQAGQPLVGQDSIEGHCVRAMYLLTAVADIATVDNDFKRLYLPMLTKLWSNMVDKKMYITGGIGAMKQWEGFGLDYFLPQGSDEGGCYAETCAGIGLIMLAERLLQLDLDAKYADVLELCLYNATLTGVSLSGKEFTYDNQLASCQDHPSTRQKWFTCPCCPPNMIRLIGTLGGYLWSWYRSTATSVLIHVHLYASASLSFDIEGKKVELSQESDWPWKGKVQLRLEADPQLDVKIKLRIPNWAPDWDIYPQAPCNITNGYLELGPGWLKENPQFTIQIPLSPRLVRPHPYTNQCTVTVVRGPIVYCAEDVDNTWVPDDHFKSTILDSKIRFEEFQMMDLPDAEPCIGIRAPNACRLIEVRSNPGHWPGVSEEEIKLSDTAQTITLIPYYARANRGGKGMMRVGLRHKI